MIITIKDKTRENALKNNRNNTLFENCDAVWHRTGLWSLVGRSEFSDVPAALLLYFIYIHV